MMQTKGNHFMELFFYKYKVNATTFTLGLQRTVTFIID